MDIEAIRMNEIYKFMVENKINTAKVTFTKTKGKTFKVDGEFTKQQQKMINKIIEENNEIYNTLKLIAQYKHGAMDKMKEITGNSSFPSLIKRWIKTSEKILPYFDCKITLTGIDKNDFCNCEEPLINKSNDEIDCGHCLKAVRSNKHITTPKK